MDIQLDKSDTAADETRWTKWLRWVQANTFTPPWLHLSWTQHPAVGYVAAVLLQVAATVVTLGLIGLFPTLAARPSLLLLIIVLVALGWGAGPSLLATLTGAMLMLYTMLPPRFTWQLESPSAGATVVLFLAAGLTTSVVASQSELRRLSAVMARQRLQTLQGVVETVLTYLDDMDELLAHVLAQITDALAVDGTVVVLLDEVRQDLAVHRAHGLAQAPGEQPHVPLGRGIVGGIAANRSPMIIVDVSAAEPEASFVKEEIRSAMGVPLVVAGRLLGVLLVGSRAPRRFAAADLQMLEWMGDRVALALNNAQGFKAEKAARAEATLRASEIEAAIEAIADAVFIYDSAGRIRLVNRAARTLFGFTSQPDYPSLPLAERLARTNTRDEQGHPLPPAQWPQLRVLRGEVFTGPRAMDVLINTLDGRDVRVSVSGAPVRDAAGIIAGGVLVLRDVTERRTLERRTHETLQSLLTMAQTLVMRPEEGETGGLLETSGRSLVGQRLVELTRNVLGCQRAGVVTYDLQQGVQHPVAVAGLSADQEQEWWSRMEGAPINDPQVPVDPDLVARILAGETLIVDMTQPPFRDQPNPFDIRTVLIAPLRLGATISGILSLDYAGHDHEYTDEEMALATAVAQLTALALERDRLQKEREEARAAALALSETNQRMDEFVSVASHELKSPLTGIQGNVQLARRRLRAARGQNQETAPALVEALAPLDTLLQRAETQVDRQSRLINDLLDLSRIQTGHLEVQLEPTDLVALVRECVDEQRLSWPDRSVSTHLPETPVLVMADADRISQVLGNYLTNAFKYADQHGPVAVSLQVQDGVATVRVQDTGPGVPLEQQQQIWDRYRRGQRGETHDARTTGGGLGLGLYISRTLVEQHGGDVGMESTPGQGSTFWFKLPLARP